MTELNKKTIKEISIGSKIHVIGNDLDIRGTINRIDDVGLGITCSESTRVGLIFNSTKKYQFELI
ncbi:MAG: hypothetical protein J6M60_06700 [Clostridia bacterium]|nr:hypothetical protein [Clostridia bacterium]